MDGKKAQASKCTKLCYVWCDKQMECREICQGDQPSAQPFMEIERPHTPKIDSGGYESVSPNSRQRPVTAALLKTSDCGS
jgi:hypothetical protein